MLELILFVAGLIGFGLAGYHDLKTTEFSEWIPYGLIIFALLVRGVFSVLTGDFLIIINSVVFGLIFLGLGALLYFLRQWGDGDAWLLGAFGFLFPVQTGLFASAKFGFIPFQLTEIFNLFFIAFFYLVVYIFVLGFRKPKLKNKFVKSLGKNIRYIVAFIVVMFAICWGMAAYLFFILSSSASLLYPIIFLPIAFVLFILFAQFASVVERDLFKKKIKAKDLKVGDVLVKGRWKGVTEEEVKKLKRKGGFVWIKEGIRFTPVFVITLIVTLVLGNVLLWFI